MAEWGVGKLAVAAVSSFGLILFAQNVEVVSSAIGADRILERALNGEWAAVTVPLAQALVGGAFAGAFAWAIYPLLSMGWNAVQSFRTRDMRVARDLADRLESARFIITHGRPRGEVLAALQLMEAHGFALPKNYQEDGLAIYFDAMTHQLRTFGLKISIARSGDLAAMADKEDASGAGSQVFHY